jgi:hypothetical protein
MSQQNEISNALRQRGQPMSEMQQMMGLMGQPGYGQDNTSLAGAMGSAGLAQAAAKRADDEARAKAEQEAALAGGGMSAAGGLLAAGMIGASFF